MAEFGEAFRKEKKNDSIVSNKKSPIPGVSSYIPFLGEDQTEKDFKRTVKPKSSENPAGNEKEEYVSRYIIPPDTPPPKYDPGNIIPTEPEPYIPPLVQPYVPLFVHPHVPLYVPMVLVTSPPPVTPLVAISENPVETNKYSGASKNTRRNKKRNLKRRGENRKRLINTLKTVDIPPNDPYWLPALENAVVAVSANYVDRSAKMEDGKDIRVRSFADGTVIAIRDDVPVVLVKASDES